MKKILLILIMGILLLSFTSSLTCWKDDIKPGIDFDLVQKCPSCSYVNITSISYPNGTTNFMNQEMTAQPDGTNFIYELQDSSQRGTIIYSTIGDKNGANPPQYEDLCVIFGKETETGESLVYFILAFGVLLLFVISFYFMIQTPYGNKRDDQGAVIQITKLKYVKLGLILLTWVLFTWFLNILIGLADNFVSLTMYYGFFGFIFDVMNRLAIPLGIFIIVVAFFEIIRDADIQKAISKFGSSK